MQENWDNVDEVIWLLDRIKWLTDLNLDHRLPTHKYIWQGSYDVWYCEQDKIDSVEIPKLRMEAAKNLGYIESEFRLINGYNVEIWKLTEKGTSLLNGSRG